jgi:hypothetical protein
MPDWHLQAFPTVVHSSINFRVSKKSITPRGPQLETLIYEIRGQRVMLDSDLARIYGVPTFRFNEAIKRNRYRFPADFMFQLTRTEFDALKSPAANSSQIDEFRQGRRFDIANCDIKTRRASNAALCLY